MDKSETNGESESLASQPIDNCEAIGASVNGEIDELRGSLPPTESDKVLSESRRKIDESIQAERSFHFGLARLGPWKRLARYREMRKNEREASESLRDQDAEENDRGQLPVDESVQVPAIWVAELYTPSTIGGLFKGITKLGWEYGRTRDSSLTKWMNDVREGRQAGWISLGMVSPPDIANFMRERTAPLPSGVTAAFPILMSLTPSVTAFIIFFQFDDAAARSIEEPLRAVYATRTHRNNLFRPWHVVRYVIMGGSLRFGRSIYSPDTVRREEVKSRLRKLEVACVKWVQGFFPGAFVSLPCSQAPTAVLLVTEKAMPLLGESRKIIAFDGLSINRDYDAWRSDTWPCARLVLPRGWDEEGKRLTFACRRHDAFPEEPGYHEPTSNWTISQRADSRIRGLLSRWAITCLLDSYHEALASLRDRVARDGRYRPVRDLKDLRSLARTMLYDIAACTKEIVELSESPGKYRHDVLDMSYARDTRGTRKSILKGFMTSQSRRAQQVQREALLLSSMLSTSNNLTQTISGIRTQRFVILLTFLSIVIASWAVFLQYSSAS